MLQTKEEKVQDTDKVLGFPAKLLLETVSKTPRTSKNRNRQAVGSSVT